MTQNSAAPTLSIIVATLNVSSVIDRCLASIQSQDYSDYELIVMDGVSIDGSIEKIKSYGAIITYFESCRDGGIYAAWNKALAHVRGEWIMFLGADDFFPNPDVLKNLMLFAKSKDVDFITVKNSLIDAKGRQIKVFGEPWNWRKFRRYMNVCHVGALHRKSYFEQQGIFDTAYQIAGDYELLMRARSSLRTADFGQIVACCGVDGISRSKVARAFYEAIRLQRSHRSLPLIISISNYALGYFSFYVKSGLRRITSRFRTSV